MATNFDINGKQIEVLRKNWDDGGVSYSFKVSSKDLKGKWHNAYVPISFRKDVSLNDHTVIRVTNSWHKVFGSEGNERLGYFINEYDGAEELPDSFSAATDAIPF